MAENKRLRHRVRISIPFAFESFAEGHQLAEHSEGATLTWTIAIRPRVGTP